jgi:tetratricopeptide (TPR) repeat protein
VLGSLGLGLLIVLLNGLHLPGSQTPGANGAKAQSDEKAQALDAGSGAQEKRQPAAAPDATADVARFIELLGKLRRNDETVVPEMRELAERLCKVDDRCDGKDILAYYLSIPPADRLRGAEESEAVNRIWGDIQDRMEAGSADPDWDRVRDDATERLREIADRSLSAPDVFPGASALSCLGFLETDRLQRDSKPTESERAKLLSTARDDVQGALVGFSKCGMLGPKIQPMYLLANLHGEAGEDRDAYAGFQDCLALARRLGQVFWQEKSFDGLLMLARGAGDLQERAELIAELSSVRTPQESWVLAKAQALLLLDQDLGSQAVEFLQNCAPSGPSPAREWQVLLGSAFLRKGDLQEARDAFAAAEPPPWSCSVRTGMALIDVRTGNPARALEQLSRPEFLENPNLLERAYAFELRGDALVRLERYDEAAHVLQAGLAIGAQLQSRIQVQRELVGAATSVIGEGVGVHAVALLAEAQARGGHPIEAALSIESWQSRTLRKDCGSAEDLSADDVVSWARYAGGGLVTWVVGAESSVAAFVAPDGTAEAVPIPRGRRSIEAAVRRLNDAIRGGDEARAERLGVEVSNGILPPSIAKRIRQDRGARVLFLVHGPLERLPIEFVFRDDGLVPLILPGLPGTQPGTSIATDELSKWNLLGNPIESAGRALLPGAREELAVVAALHSAGRIAPDQGNVQAGSLDDPGVRVRAGASFDRNAVTRALGESHPVHIATHLVHGCGRSQGRIADVGLELSGGANLCAQEILEIRPRLPLAVLDACETAEGRFVDAEGLQGVARAFLESGTRNLVVTLWPVEDQAARAFAEEFHRQLIAGRRPSEAVTEGRARLRARGFPSADWAAFRLVGRD